MVDSRNCDSWGMDAVWLHFRVAGRQWCSCRWVQEIGIWFPKPARSSAGITNFSASDPEIRDPEPETCAVNLPALEIGPKPESCVPTPVPQAPNNLNHNSQPRPFPITLKPKSVKVLSVFPSPKLNARKNLPWRRQDVRKSQLRCWI